MRLTITQHRPNGPWYWGLHDLTPEEEQAHLNHTGVFLTGSAHNEKNAERDGRNTARKIRRAVNYKPVRRDLEV